MTTTQKPKPIVHAEETEPLKVLDAKDLPVWSRRSKYLPYKETFELLKAGQAVLIGKNSKTNIGSVYSFLKRKGYTNMRTKSHEGNYYIIKTV